jgi:hypothetical protein
MSRSRIHRGQGGFTLVELLVAVMIEGLIVGALAAAFIGILRSSTQVNESLSRSSDARIAAAYIVNDASNSSGPEVSVTDTTSCADPSPPLAGSQTPVVRFNSTITSSSGGAEPDIVIYYLVGTSLLRRECQNGALTSDNAVASFVASVSVACSPTADCSGTPTSITVTITETATASGPQYVYSLTGTFQKTVGSGSPESVVLLGGGTCGANAGINIVGSGQMRVYGDAYLNTKDNGATCGAITLAGGATYAAGSTSILNGGTCQAPAYLVCPPITNYATPHPDPYATMTPPSVTGRPNVTASTQCQTPGSTAQPGVYAAKLNITNDHSCQLQSGVYILQGGLSVSGSAALTSAPGGVLLYITGGSLDVGGSGSVNISPLTIGPWAGILVWQDKLDTGTISYSGASPLVLNGVVYAPTAQLNISGSAANPTLFALVVKSIFISGTGKIFVGSQSVPGLSIGAPPTTSWPQGKSYSATFTGAGGDGNYIWAASNLPSGLNMDPDTGTISGTPNAAGPKSVTVTLNDSYGDDPATPKTYTLTIDPLPTVTSTSPSSRGQGAVSENVTITGTGFINGAALATSFSGSGITVNSTTFNSATSLTANITIAAGAATGARDVTVTNGDTGVGTGVGKFTVNAKPTVTSASPAARGQGAANQNIVITGTGFVNGAALATSFSGAGITVNSTTFNSATQVTANVTVGAGAATGAGDVTVTNGDAGVGTGSGKFTVNAGPVVTSATPSSRPQGSTSQNIVIAGSGFVSGSGVSFSGTGITLNSTTFNNANQITVNITIAGGASASARNITVTNPDAGTGVGTGAFTVSALPTVVSTSPSSRPVGATSQNIGVTGTGFQSGAAATFSGTGITVNSTTFNSPTSLTVNVTIAVGATVGARNLTVLNPDTGSGVGAGVFTVNALPSVTSTSPSSRGQNAANQNIVITGTGFQSGAVASFSGAGLTVNSTTFTNSTSVTANVTIASNAATGARDVTVTNPDGGVGTGNSKFTVNVAPTITSLAPSTHAKKSNGVSVTITGTGFVSGATVTLVATSGTAPSVTGTTWNSSTSITITLNIPNSTSTDNVVVTNPDGGTVTKIAGFTAT